MIQFKVDDSQIVRYFNKALEQGKTRRPELFNIIGAFLNQLTQLAWRTQGARSGHTKWADLEQSTIYSKAGTRKLRYGTDTNPKRSAKELWKYKLELMRAGKWSMYQRGYMPGYERDRRYNQGNMPMRASGTFQRSFGIMSVTANELVFGTRYDKAEEIMSGSGKNVRNVLFMMPSDYNMIKNQVAIWMRSVWR